ncbi:MAG TPA: efflux RND transporter periplasmic adaptor subunit [Gemmatimonadales bacterium]|jgi:HlyD family secretion protein
MKRSTITISLLALAMACSKPVPPPLYEAVPVVHRDIVVSAEAAGAVEAITVINVKSRASGTILRMPAQTGQKVRIGDTLVLVDKRDPTNSYNQAEAELQVARATLQNADSNRQRIEAMYHSQVASEQDRETAILNYSTAQSQLVRAQIALQQANDALADCNVLSTVSGVVLTKGVDVGTVIASAVNQVSGGTTLLTMANLDTVQLRVQVDETDIGKIQADQEADITVDAFPNHPFHGQVLKIEPQSTVNNNVTMFPVLIWIPNMDPRATLLPGMNAEVQIHVANTSNVLAIPNAALRTPRDVTSAAQVLGLNPTDVLHTLAQEDSQAAKNRGQLAEQPSGSQNETSGSIGGSTPPNGRRSTVDGRPRASSSPSAVNGQRSTGQGAPMAQGAAPGGQGRQRPPLPEGVTEDQWAAIRAKRQNGQALTPAESTIAAKVRASFQQNGGYGGGQGQAGAPGDRGQGQTAQATAAPQTDAAQGAGASMDEVRAAFQKRMSGQPLSAHEQQILQQAASRMGGGGGRRGGGASNNNFIFGGSYIVFVKRAGKPTPVRVRTGITDMDYSEVKSGLTDKDTVLLLPSASLVQSQQDMKDRFQRMTGGGGVPGMAQQTARPTTQAQPAGPRN